MCKHLFGYLVVALFVGSALSSSILQDIIDRIPKEERFNFVKHHIQVGYNLSEGKNVPETRKSAIDLPGAFSIMLYKYARQEGLVTDEDTLKMLREVICFEDGVCIDIGDIGVHP